MVTFDAAQPGTSPDAWVADPRLHDRPLLEWSSVDEVVVIGAHPDDETLGAGGLISLCHDRGIPVRIVCVTDGAASHPDRPRLGQARSAELTNAISALAPDAHITMLGFPDGRTREHRREITRALAEALHPAGASALLVAPWRGDGHRDHRVVGEVVRDVADGRRVREYPIWMWHWASPDHPDTPWGRMESLPVSGDAKVRAISCFTSQISGDPPVLRADFLQHFHRDQEIFIS